PDRPDQLPPGGGRGLLPRGGAGEQAREHAREGGGRGGGLRRGRAPHRDPRPAGPRRGQLGHQWGGFSRRIRSASSSCAASGSSTRQELSENSGSSVPTLVARRGFLFRPGSGCVSAGASGECSSRPSAAGGSCGSAIGASLRRTAAVRTLSTWALLRV